MSYYHKPIILVFLGVCFFAQPAFSKAVLGISFPEKSSQTVAPFSDQMEEASGNLITVHNYNNDKTLLSMLTKFRKLDAALISRQSYDLQPVSQLVSLGEVKVSDSYNQTTLILATRADLTENQEFQLVQGYHELLMSTEGMELLERYAQRLSSKTKQIGILQQPITINTNKKMSAVKEISEGKVEESVPKSPSAPAEDIALLANDPKIITENISGEAPAIADHEISEPKAVVGSMNVVKPADLSVQEKSSVEKIIASDAPGKETFSRKSHNKPLISTEHPELQVNPAVSNSKLKTTATQASPKENFRPAKGATTKSVDTQSAQTTERQHAWQAHIDVVSKLGNDRSLSEIELFFPSKRTLDGLLFLDLRFQLDDNDSVEGNFGIGYRELIDSRWIFGTYAFLDLRRSENDNTFRQITLGTEALTKNYDARLNLYLADDKEYILAKQGSLNKILYQGNNLVYQTGGVAFESREKAMSGVDAELGWRLPWFRKQEVRSYLGGFFFDASGVEEITGPRGRVEIRFNDIFNWPGSLFELGGEITHDDVRDTNYFITARARFPFFGIDKKKNQRTSPDLSTRMTERIQRDPDIVITRQHNDASTPIRQDLLSYQGESTPITFRHINSNAAAGTGSVESPCSALDCIDVNDDVILLYADSDFTLTAPVSLAEGQRLLGETGTHTLLTEQLGEIKLPFVTTGITKPVLRDFAGTAIVLANGSEVSAIDIKQVNTAIEGNNVGGIKINNVNISKVDDGIFLNGLTSYAPTVIKNNHIEAVVFDGIYLYNNDASPVSATILENTLQLHDAQSGSNGLAGIFLENGGQEIYIHVADNLITGTDEAGILVENLPLGNIMKVIMDNNSVGEGRFDGISMINGAGANQLSVYLRNNNASGDISLGGTDYYLYNLGTLFELGATPPNAAIGQSSTTSDLGVINAEGNLRFDGSTADVFVDNLLAIPSGPINIVDKSTILTP